MVIRSLQTGQEREIPLAEPFRLGVEYAMPWSPDGRSILIAPVASGTPPHGGLYRLDVASGKITPIVPFSDGIKWPAGWSPDGKKVFFGRGHWDRATRTITSSHILVRSLETGQETELYRAENPGGLGQLVVSPDGQQLAFAPSRPSAKALMVLPTEGGKPRELLHVQEGEIDPEVVAWTPDGRYVLFGKQPQGSSGKVELWRIPAEGGESQKLELASRPRNFGRPRIHPDGRRIAFTANRRVEQLRMLEIFVSPESAKASCLANLRTIRKAIQQYKKQHGDVPNWLCDLYPDYLQDTSLVLCPADRTGGTPLWGPEGSKMRCSYQYAFSPSRKEVEQLYTKYYGGVVPLVHCRHHRASLWLSYDGDIYEVPGPWDTSAQAITGLLSQLRKAVEANPDAWAQQYDMSGCMSVLAENRDIAKFAELLREQIEKHPDLTSKGAEELLAVLGKLRFVSRSEDDAEESVEGRMDLDRSDLDMGQEEKLVGIRFADIRIPKGAQIKKAHLQFTAEDDNEWEPTELTIHAELAASAKEFTAAEADISSRKRTKASVKWSPERWDFEGQRSEKQCTPDLSSLIREVIAQPGWRQGNALVFIISGSGERDAESYDGDKDAAPMLYVEY
jgi:Tol biopolymer transport system component